MGRIVLLLLVVVVLVVAVRQGWVFYTSDSQSVSAGINTEAVKRDVKEAAAKADHAFQDLKDDARDLKNDVNEEVRDLKEQARDNAPAASETVSPQEAASPQLEPAPVENPPVTVPPQN